MKKIAFLGECMIELNGEAFGNMKQSFGGDTLNSAVYLNRLDPNIQPYYVTSVGNDALSKKMLKLWHAEHIDTSLTLIDPDHQTGLYQISLDEHGERTFSYWRKNSAASRIFKHKDISMITTKLAQFDYLYISGISIAILPDEDKERLIEVLAVLKNEGVKIVFDSNYRPKLWASQQQAQEYYSKVIPLCEYALITFDDEMDLWGDKLVSDATTRLSDLGVKKFVLKMGAEGCVHYKFENDYLMSEVFAATEVTKVVDTTSAGDSFNAGFLCELLRSGSYEKGCRLGNDIAGLVIQHKGAIIPKYTTDLFVLVNSREK